MEQVTSIIGGGHRGSLTRSDLAALADRDDGLRYELLDGAVLVTPSPSRHHQIAVTGLVYALSVLPAHLRVVTALLDVELAPDTIVQPDLVVVDREEFADSSQPVRPVLVVEILSPSTRGIDQVLKRERYQQADIASYWIIDPETPSALVLELDGDGYREVSRATSSASLTVTAPAPLTLRPQDWLR